MRLSISKSRNKTFYYAIDSKRQGKKVTSSVICKFGEHNELLAQGIEDPKAYCLEKVNEMNKEAKDQIVTLTDTFDCRQRTEVSTDIVSLPTFKNIGYRYLLEIIKKLDLKSFVDSIKTKARYDSYAICSHLVVDRILYPRSKRAAFFNKGIYLDDFDYGLHDSYRFLEVLSDKSEQMQTHLFNKTKNIVSLDSSIFIYDCTNFYWESEKEDEDEIDDHGDITQWGLRKYGASKEHRPNPIVQMGLFTDKNGIPISYCVEHGSNNEQNTIIPLEQQMINKYHASNFIYCSDAGLGSLKCRVFNSLPGRNYVVTHSLKKTDKKELDLIFKDVNWQIFGNGNSDPNKDKPVSIEAFKNAWAKKLKNAKENSTKEELTDEELMLTSHDMVYKKFPLKRKVSKEVLKELGFSIASGITISEDLYITFSMKYFLYEEEILDDQIERAQKKIDNKDIESSNPNDVRRLITKDSVTKQGEVCDEVILNLDMKEIAKERKFHGFYAIATNLDKSIEDILEITSQRWKIEQSFRILKSEMDVRPVYAWTPEGIKGHFAICYIALLVYRILERLLKLQNEEQNTFSSTQIITTLKNLNIDKMENGKIYKALYSPSVILQELEKQFHLKLNAKYFKVETIEGKLK